MAINSHTQAKRHRESEKAQKKKAKAARRAQRRTESADQSESADQFEVVSAEDIVGNLPSTSQAMRAMEERARVSKETAPLPSKLFVGSLTDMVTEAVLMDLFSKYGTVSEAAIIKDRNSNQSRGFAFVTLANRHDAAKTIEALDGYELDGRQITVKVATKR